MNSTPTHSLDELRAAVKAETPNENKRSVRRRELDRFSLLLPAGAAEVENLNHAHVERWWTGMGTLVKRSGDDRLKALVAVFEIAKGRGWLKKNHARELREQLKLDRKRVTALARADSAGAAHTAAPAGPRLAASDEESKPEAVPPPQVQAHPVAGPAAADPAQAELAAAEAKKRARVAEKRARMIERLKLTPRASCDLCDHRRHGCEYGFPARWEVPDQDVGDCLVTGHSRSTLRDLTDSQDGAPPEVKASSDKGKRIIHGEPYCARMRRLEIQAKETS